MTSPLPRFLFTAFLFFAGISLSGAEKPDPAKMPQDEFFRIVRHVPAQETWAKMSGTAMHKRKGHRRIQSPIKLGVRFTPSGITAQLVFQDKEQSEIYDLGQTFGSEKAVVDSRIKQGAAPQLPLYGIDVRDLTLNFIYQDILREEEPCRVSLFPCRVFMLKGVNQGETARVYVSLEYFFPVKVEWFKKDPGTSGEKPYRTLEIGAVSKKNDFYLISEIDLDGPDWKTRIDFPDRDAGFVKDGTMPEDLFIIED